MKHEIKLPIGIGISSLLMMFITLTLTSLMVLSLVTANRQLALSKKNTRYVQSYYKADATANIKRLEVINQIESLEEDKSLKEILSPIQDISVSEETDKIQVNYEIPMMDSQVLSVSLFVNFPYHKNSQVQVEKWYVKNNAEESYEEEGFGEIIIP